MILFIKHAQIEGPGTLEDFFKQTEWQVKIVELWSNRALPAPDECEAVISLGGPMNVYETDKYPFLKKEEAFLKETLKNEIPVLGICLGAQLLAKLAGAKVTQAAAKEIGWYEVELTKNIKGDILFRGIDSPLKVFQWHQDSFAVPDNGVLLATSNVCKNQAFRLGKYAWGLQFHPEMTESMLEAWLNDTEEDLEREKIMLSYFKAKQAYDKQANMLYLNFAIAIAKQVKVSA